MRLESVKCEDLPPFNDAMARFDARYWSIDYPLSATATIVADDPHQLDVYCQFRANTDLVGLLWISEDRFGHPLFAYQEDIDYSGTVLAFQANFHNANETTVTITAAGVPHVVRLFPYTLSDGVLTPVSLPAARPLPSYAKHTVAPSVGHDPSLYWYVIDFDDLYTGYTRDGAKVSPRSIQQLFISIVPPGYGLSDSAKLRDTGRIDYKKVETTTIDGFWIDNVSPDLILSRGDVLSLTYSYPLARPTKKGYYITLESQTMDVRVDEWSGLGTTSRFLKSPQPIRNVAFIGGRASSVKLKRPSPLGVDTLNLSLRNMEVSGTRARLPRRRYVQAPHPLQMTSGYDDTYNITPYRQVSQAYWLGYRGRWTSYMGMSHYFSASSYRDGTTMKLQVDKHSPTPINLPTVKHVENLLSYFARWDYEFVWSSSYEILDTYMPEEWKQRDLDGRPALSGWVPPSSFIIPTHPECLDYLTRVIRQGLGMMQAAGLPLRFQIGEPWWWDGSYTNRKPCIYDSHTTALWTAETGLPVPTPHIDDYTLPVTEAQRPYLKWLGNKLGASTQRIRDGVKAAYPDALATLLFFTPQIMTPNSEMLPIINFPKAQWVYPNFDFTQIEDYDWLINGEMHLNPRTFEAALHVLGYPQDKTDYFIGFVLTAAQRWVWPNMNLAIVNAQQAGIRSIAVWAYPQVIRDGIVVTDTPFASSSPIMLPPGNKMVPNTGDLLITPELYVQVGEARMVTGTAERHFGGHTWYPVGELGGVTPLTENATHTASGWQLTLNRVPGGLVTDRDIARGEEARIYLSVNSAAPALIGRARVTEFRVEHHGAHDKVVCVVRSPLQRTRQKLTTRYSDADQRASYPDDKGLEFVAAVNTMRLEWGK